MKLFALHILYKQPEAPARFLQSANELSQFGYFQRSSVREFLDFTTKLVTERTDRASRASVKEQEYLCHVYVRHDNLAGVLVSDQEYPQRVGQNLLTKILEEFLQTYPADKWETMTENSGNLKRVGEFLQRYQNPNESDPLTRLQNDVDETKIILHNTLDAVLSRGEKIDDLVQRSEDLSSQSKMFYMTAKKTNKCCTLL